MLCFNSLDLTDLGSRSLVLLNVIFVSTVGPALFCYHFDYWQLLHVLPIGFLLLSHQVGPHGFMDYGLLI